MITAQPRLSALVTRLKRRAEAMAIRRAHEIAREARTDLWREPSALWPDFTQD